MKSLEEIIRLLQEAKPELAARFGVQRLAVFGSCARGDQREESDIDVLVETAALAASLEGKGVGDDT